ncbi:hypothetical protein [Streptococcus jiangjianxini]|uniref:hypothetical protein n=1 Tax=Streptococcus jiangjianxini TaxID=3161189 RepID=UPI0032EAE620
MLEIYLGRNSSRNQRLLDFFDVHGISYSCKNVSDLSREDLMALFTKCSDCFALLSPSLKHFKCSRETKLSGLVTLVLRKPEQNLRLPLVVYQEKVYPEVSLEEARTFLPREQKEAFFRRCLFKDMTGKESL